MKCRAWIACALAGLSAAWLCAASLGTAGSEAKLPRPAAAGALGAIRVNAVRARSSAEANRRAARPAAEGLLAALVLPAGATPATADESREGLLSGPLLRVATPDLVDVHRFWRLSGRPCKAMSWIDRHPPANSTRTVSAGPAPDACQPEAQRPLPPAIAEEVPTPPVAPSSWGAQFSFPAQPGRFSAVGLVVQVAAAKDGGTALRVDAQVVWTLPRPATERIPAGTERVLLKVDEPRGRVHFTHSIEDVATIARIVAIVEGLERSQPGTSNCPLDDGKAAVIELSFEHSGAGKPLARVVIDENGCASVDVRIDGRPEPELSGAYEARKALEALLGRRL
jgi:hypothetical protein